MESACVVRVINRVVTLPLPMRCRLSAVFLTGVVDEEPVAVVHLPMNDHPAVIILVVLRDLSRSVLALES